MPRLGDVVSALALLVSLSSSALGQEQPDCVDCNPDPPTVTIMAPAVSYTASVSITIKWCAVGSELDPDSREIDFAWGDSTSKFSYTPGFSSKCDDYATSSATLTLAPGVHPLVASIRNVAGSLGQDYQEVVYAPAPTITIVTPAANGANGRAIVRSRFPLVLATFGGTPHQIDTASLVVTLGGDTVTPLVRRQLTLMEWEVDSLHQFTPGDSTDLSVRVCDIYASCATVTRRAVLDNSGAPIVQFTGMPLEALGRVAAAPVGPGLVVTGGDVETGFSVPAYIAMGTPWSAGLVYSTRTSHPRGLVNADIELTWPAGTPDQLKAVLIDGAARLDSVVVSSPACSAAAGRLCRVALQADFAGTVFTRPVRKWLKVEVTVTSGGTPKVSTDSVEVVIADRRRSPYGAGWAVAGVSRLDSAGSDMILTGPTGLATVFRGSGGRYLSPPGDVSILRWTGSEWQVTTRGVPYARVVFSASGRLTTIVDRNSNYTRIAYVGAAPRLDSVRVDSITDPTGRSFRFGYTDSTRVTITDPGSRVSVARINTGRRLVVDTTASPASRPATSSFAYQSTGPNGAVMLSALTDPAGRRTGIAYSARWRFVRDTLPAVLPETGSTTVSPVIAFTAQELRALGTLVSADSVYAAATGPLGNVTRSHLTRWGSAWKVWDAIGVVSRASYRPDGSVAWSQAADDSTRVSFTYDAMGRLAGTVRVQGSVRLDSLVYDANHRVIKRFGALGSQDTTRFWYDYGGRLTTVRAPSGDTTRTWYRNDGLVDSTRAAQDTMVTRYTYDASWKNLTEVRDADTAIVAQNLPDNLGRVTTSVRRTVADASSSATTFAWSRQVIAYATDNLPDSARSERSADCQCYSNCTFGQWQSAAWPGDTLHLDRAVHHRDALGRDTLVTDKFGRGARTVYDAEERVRALFPFRDSTGIVDSMRYDVAGRLRYRWTRRGTRIEYRYDTRGRSIADSIPGFGTVRRTYAGPNAELTRLWVDGYVDSIGGVNPELRWGYDHGGRLLADTAQGGRVTAYTRDRLGRDSVVVNVAGTTRVFYDAALGSPSGPSVRTPVGTLDRWRSFTQAGRLRLAIDGFEYYSFQQSVLHGYGGRLGHLVREYFNEDSMLARRDSFRFDGHGRLYGARYLNGMGGDDSVVLLRSEVFTFDGRGNIGEQGVARAYDAVTNRLRVVGSDTLVYDRAGNLVTRKVAGGSTWTYTYDPVDRLIAVRYGGTLIARYGYDALGRRIARRVYSGGPRSAPTEFVRLVYAGGQVAAETDSGGAVTVTYTWGLGTDNLAALRVASTTYLVVQDALYSTRALIRKSTGVVAVRWRWRAYGLPLDSSSVQWAAVPVMRYRWAGQPWDPETGFYYMRARYYDPSVQRFTQDDPSHPVGDYGYADGNPTDGRDPSGLTKDWIMSMPDPGDPRLRECWGTFDGCHEGGGGGWGMGPLHRGHGCPDA